MDVPTPPHLLNCSFLLINNQGDLYVLETYKRMDVPKIPYKRMDVPKIPVSYQLLSSPYLSSFQALY